MLSIIRITLMLAVALGAGEPNQSSKMYCVSTTEKPCKPLPPSQPWECLREEIGTVTGEYYEIVIRNICDTFVRRSVVELKFFDKDWYRIGAGAAFPMEVIAPGEKTKTRRLLDPDLWGRAKWVAVLRYRSLP